MEFKKKLLNESVSNGVNTNFDKVEKRKKKYKVMNAYEVLYNVDWFLIYFDDKIKSISI